MAGKKFLLICLMLFVYLVATAHELENDDYEEGPQIVNMANLVHPLSRGRSCTARSEKRALEEGYKPFISLLALRRPKAFFRQVAKNKVILQNLRKEEKKCVAKVNGKP